MAKVNESTPDTTELVIRTCGVCQKPFVVFRKRKFVCSRQCGKDRIFRSVVQGKVGETCQRGK